MQCLTIQIDSSFIDSFDRQDFLRRLNAMGRSPEIDAFEEKGRKYLNFNFFTELPKALWDELQIHIYKHDDYGRYISSVSVVACEGERTEDDLLLHHFDKTIQCDSLSL